MSKVFLRSQRRIIRPRRAVLLILSFRTRGSPGPSLFNCQIGVLHCEPLFSLSNEETASLAQSLFGDWRTCKSTELILGVVPPPRAVPIADLPPSQWMHGPMTVRTERDQVFARVVSECASRTEVMDVQIRRTATLLAPPSISRKNLSAQLRVSQLVQPKARASLV